MAFVKNIYRNNGFHDVKSVDLCSLGLSIYLNDAVRRLTQEVHTNDVVTIRTEEPQLDQNHYPL